jgi:nuclear polyadenylated RNA-binding protein 3
VTVLKFPCPLTDQAPFHTHIDKQVGSDKHDLYLDSPPSTLPSTSSITITSPGYQLPEPHPSSISHHRTPPLRSCAPLPPPTTMPADGDVNSTSDTIVVGGDCSEDSARRSDDSFDAYGGEGEGVEEQMQNAPDLANDDYAKTFESPPASEHQGNAALPQSEEADVSMASESMNNSSAPDTLRSGSPSASTPVPSSLPSSAVPQPTNGAAHTSSDSSGDDGHQSTPSTQPSASASPSPTSQPPGRPSSASPAVAAPEATEGIDVSAEAPAPASPSEDGVGEINIEKLVDDITAGAANPPKGPPSAAAPAPEPTAAPATATPSLAPTQPLPTPTPNAVLRTLTVSPSASLPPKPAVSHHLPNHSFQARASHAQSHATQRGPYMSTGPPGVAGDGFSSLPPPPSSYGGPHAPSHGLPAAAHPGSHGAWETFLADEKRYTSDGNWERFPEGSRIFIGKTLPCAPTLQLCLIGLIGNLSSERVSKREVYDVFSKFGRLAQISLKNAYGFVQYHTIAEGNAAMQNAQDMEMGGRKIRKHSSQRL